VLCVVFVLFESELVCVAVLYLLIGILPMLYMVRKAAVVACDALVIVPGSSRGYEYSSTRCEARTSVAPLGPFSATFGMHPKWFTPTTGCQGDCISTKTPHLVR